MSRCGDVHEAARALRDYAYKKGSCDNISVIVVSFSREFLASKQPKDLHCNADSPIPSTGKRVGRKGSMINNGTIKAPKAKPKSHTVNIPFVASGGGNVNSSISIAKK